MVDKLKLFATVIVIFGAGFAYYWWTNHQEEKILAKVHELTNTMCECKTVECATPVLQELLSIGDEELRVGEDGTADNWQKSPPLARLHAAVLQIPAGGPAVQRRAIR